MIYYPVMRTLGREGSCILDVIATASEINVDVRVYINSSVRN